jgi:hypothetical protein
MAVIPVYLLLLVVAGLGMGQVGLFLFYKLVFFVLSVSCTTIFVCFVYDILSLVISCMLYFCLQFF